MKLDNAIDVWSALRVLMAWWFSTRASVVPVLSKHLCVCCCSWVNSVRLSDSYRCLETFHWYRFGLSPVLCEATLWTSVCQLGPSGEMQYNLYQNGTTFISRKLILNVACKMLAILSHDQTLGNPPVLGPRPVKTVEDRWKPLSCRSSCPVIKIPTGSPSNVEKNLVPVKVLEDQ